MEDLVIYDYQHGKKAVMKNYMACQFQNIWRAQEEAKLRSEIKVRNLLLKVATLEKETWDRIDAKEDSGAK